jgi:hypothetical protein
MEIRELLQPVPVLLSVEEVAVLVAETPLGQGCRNHPAPNEEDRGRFRDIPLFQPTIPMAPCDICH